MRGTESQSLRERERERRRNCKKQRQTSRKELRIKEHETQKGTDGGKLETEMGKGEKAKVWLG